MEGNDSIEILSEMARNRTRLLRLDKGVRRKVVGYSGSHVAEILIGAAGATPTSLCRVGVVEAPGLTPRASVRGGLARRLDRAGPLRSLLDLVIVRQVDDAHCAVLQARGGRRLPVVEVPVPGDWDDPRAMGRYRVALGGLERALEAVTGCRVTEAKLRRAAAAQNEVHALLGRIDELRRREAPPISGRDFLRLGHACFDVDHELLVPWLEGILDELDSGPSAFEPRAPRLVLCGRVLPIGDTALPRLVEDAGGAIVAEMIDEGVQPFRSTVDLDGDIYQAMAEATYVRRPPLLDFQVSTWKRFQALRRLVDCSRAQGVVSMRLPRDRVADLEAECFAHWLSSLGVPVLEVSCVPGAPLELDEALAERARQFVDQVSRRPGPSAATA